MAANDILTLAEAKLQLNKATADVTDDAEIAATVTGVSDLIDTLVGPVVTREITAETHNGGTAVIRLLRPPVASVTTVVEYARTTATALTAQTPGTAPAAGYLLDGGQLWRTSGGDIGCFAAGLRNVVVTYQAGRGATAAQAFKSAARSILDHQWNTQRPPSRRSGGGEELVYARGYLIPNQAMKWLEPYLADRGGLVA